MIAHHRRRGRSVDRPGEEGVVGGLEVIPFGLLVFVAGGLLFANAWAVVDAKFAVEVAAREGARAYVEAADGPAAGIAAAGAARRAVAGAGRDPSRLGLEDNGPAFERCAVVELEATYDVPALTLPFIGRFGDGITVHGRHREVIDPYASGGAGEADCG